MIADESCLRAYRFSTHEIAVLQQKRVPEAEASLVLRNHASGLPPREVLAVILYEIHSAIDLGLVDHAQALFAGLQTFLDRHPHLQPQERRTH